MKWSIPSKTFLLGEYAALAQGSAIVLTTQPYFELSLTDKSGMQGIHPDSPAGIWWQQSGLTQGGIDFHDPYNNLGGLGASSAQFLGCYLAECYLQNLKPQQKAMLQAYYQSAWDGQGLKPSGYDILAQTQQGCVYINQQKNIIQSYAWPFKDLSLILVHTGKKLATHQHLQSTTLPQETEQLSKIADQARLAFELVSSATLLDAINQYHQHLLQLNLVALHSQAIINKLRAYPEILAIKGCGALGSDVLLILTSTDESALVQEKLKAQLYSILATEQQITPLDKKTQISIA